MAGLALVLDLFSAAGGGGAVKLIHSSSSLSSLSAALSASLGVTFLPSYPAFSSQFRPRDWAGTGIAFCEELADTAELLDTEEPWLELDARWLPQLESKQNPPPGKPYNVELKPLFSAFRPRALGATIIRACLVNFSAVVETYIQPQDDDDDDTDRPPSMPVDPIVPLKRSAMHAVREVSVITTRRILERATVHFASRRMAWKLLKDVPKSAVRKAARETSKYQIFAGVTRTTFRGHALGVMANWVVQLILDIYTYLYASSYPKNIEEKNAPSLASREEASKKDLNRLLRKTAGSTLKGSASLILASIGAGVGTILIKPSIGTWIGCAAGDLAGPFLIGIWFDAWVFYGTFSPPGLDP